jgi:ankyrin repeat protein
MTLEEVLKRCSDVPTYLFKPVTSLNQRDLHGDTPLHVVCVWGDLEPVKVLIEAGADVNARGDRGQTPLFRAVTGENIEVVRLLLRAGADRRILDDDGRPVARFARNVGADEIADLIDTYQPH